jgi:hypothetical protein
MSLSIPETDYSWENFLNYLINDDHFYYLKVLGYHCKYFTWDDEDSSFMNVLFNNDVIITNMGEIKKLTFKYIDKIYGNKILVDFYCYLNGEEKLLTVISCAKTEDINNTLIKFVRNNPNLYHLPVTSSTFNLLSHYLKEKYIDTECVSFIGKHTKKMKLKGDNRSNYNRTILYYGNDGFDSYYELRNLYGIILTDINYSIPQYGEYEISNSGKVSLQLGSKTISDTKLLLFEIYSFIVKDILWRRNIINKAKYELIQYKTNTKTYEIPSIDPLIIKFGNKLSDEQLPLLIETLNENDFILYNDSITTGNSVALNSMVFDENKKNIFLLHADNLKIIVAPYTALDTASFLKLYESITNFDPNAKLVGEYNES